VCARPEPWLAAATPAASLLASSVARQQVLHDVPAHTHSASVLCLSGRPPRSMFAHMCTAGLRMPAMCHCRRHTAAASVSVRRMQGRHAPGAAAGHVAAAVRTATPQWSASSCAVGRGQGRVG